MKDRINIGICGLGTVGAGTAQLLQKNAEVIENRTETQIRVTRAATIDPYSHLDIDFSDITVTDSVDDILNDPEIDVVVELIGGDGLAKKIVLEALEKGKSVVTANKALLAKHSAQIFSAAYQSKGQLGYEASVGGGIPIIRSIKEGFSGDVIESFSGIMNGTGNYILSAMTNDHTDFDAALRTAQELGFAEADPTFDIEGIDTAHKVIILMELAFNSLFEFEELYVEGITQIESTDIELANELGYKIKLLGMAKQSEKGFEGRVHPALVPSDSLLAAVQGPFNAISVHGNFVGHTMSYGAGAGSHPTASAVVADIIDISRSLNGSGDKSVAPLSVPFEKLEKRSILPIDDIESQYYLRCDLMESNDLEELKSELSNCGIDILLTAMSSSSSNEGGLSCALITKTMVESEIAKMVKASNKLPFVRNPIKIIRVET